MDPAEPREALAPSRLTFFARVKDSGRLVYFLRPAALYSYRGGAAVAAGHVGAIRARLDKRRLQDCGYLGRVAEIDDAAIAAAAVSGVVGNPAFLGIVDSLLVRAACLCCYYTRSQARAENAERQVWTLLGYFAQSSYETSNAFYRALAGLLRDASPAEAAMVARHEAGLRELTAGSGPAEAQARAWVRAVNRRRRVCAACTFHPQGSFLYRAAQASEPGLLASAGVALCVYSTPEGRRLLRRIGKACKAAGLTLATRIATSGGYEFFCLRYKLRAYVLEVYPAVNGSAAAQTRLEAFWTCAAQSR